MPDNEDRCSKCDFKEGYYRLLELLTTHCFDHEDLAEVLHSEMLPVKPSDAV